MSRKYVFWGLAISLLLAFGYFSSPVSAQSNIAYVLIESGHSKLLNQKIYKQLIVLDFDLSNEQASSLQIQISKLVNPRTCNQPCTSFPIMVKGKNIYFTSTDIKKYQQIIEQVRLITDMNFDLKVKKTTKIPDIYTLWSRPNTIQPFH